MTALSRLTKLEAISSPPRSARAFIVFGGGAGFDTTAFVRSQGEAADGAHDVIVHYPWLPDSPPELVAAYNFDASKYQR